VNITSLKEAIGYISNIMQKNRDYLVELDQQNGDGDLGITMSNGYKAIFYYLSTEEEKDLGKALMKCSSIFNEAAPSTLGTITSLGLMGMAKVLKGKVDANVLDIAVAMEAGLDKIMDKAKSKPGDKTILDSIFPAIQALKEHAEEGSQLAFKFASEAARFGSESTRNMRSVHGRAAYYGDKSIGIIDGGSVVGKLIFESLYSYCIRNQGELNAY
jgi:phosphoenolpyruvate---glycerone phosphotransferase subunit DhaL